MHITVQRVNTSDQSFESLSSTLMLSAPHTQRVMALMRQQGVDVEKDGLLGDGEEVDTTKGLDLKKIAFKIAAAIARAIRKMVRKGVKVTKDTFFTILRFFTGQRNNTADQDVKVRAIIDQSDLFTQESSGSNNTVVKIIKTNNQYVLAAYNGQNPFMFLEEEESRFAKFTRTLMAILTKLSWLVVATIVTTVTQLIVQERFKTYMFSPGLKKAQAAEKAAEAAYKGIKYAADATF